MGYEMQMIGLGVLLGLSVVSILAWVLGRGQPEERDDFEYPPGPIEIPKKKSRDMWDLPDPPTKGRA